MCSGVIWKTIFTEHSLTVHQDMPLESLLYKEKSLHLLNVEMMASSLGLNSSDGLEENGNVCCGQMNPCFSLIWGENRIEFSVPKTEILFFPLQSIFNQISIKICSYFIQKNYVVQ